MPLEVTREVGLIAETDAGGDLRDRLAVEETLSRRLDSPPENVGMRCDSERLAEAANEMRRARSEALAGRGKCHDLELVRVEELAQSFRELARQARTFLVGVPLEMHPDALGHEGHVRLGLERLVGVTEPLVQNVEAMTQAHVLDRRLVDGAADQALAQ